jgi:hypothetical protein
MSPYARAARALLCLTSLALASACTSGSTGAPTAAGFAQTTVAGRSTSPSPTGSTPPTSAPSTSAAPVAPPKAVEQTRAAASLRKALLALDDLPAGFSEEKEEAEGGPAVITSKKAGCTRLVTLMNAEKVPGSMAGATRTFSSGADGLVIDEMLDAMGSPHRVKDLHASIERAVAGCPSITFKVPAGTSKMTVRKVSAPDVGTDAVAFRITAEGGDLDGFEATQVSVAVEDVELTMIFYNAYPEEIEGAAEDAYSKAASVLVRETTAS